MHIMKGQAVRLGNIVELFNKSGWIRGIGTQSAFYLRKFIQWKRSAIMRPFWTLSNEYWDQTLLHSCINFDVLRWGVNFEVLKFSKRHPNGEFGGTVKDLEFPSGGSHQLVLTSIPGEINGNGNTLPSLVSESSIRLLAAINDGSQTHKKAFLPRPGIFLSAVRAQSRRGARNHFWGKLHTMTEVLSCMLAKKIPIISEKLARLYLGNQGLPCQPE